MNHRIFNIIVVFAAIFLASFFLYLQRGTVYAQLDSMKLIPHPERFTELYFVAMQPASFSFGIHNVEYATMTYPYEVYFQSSNGNRTDLAHGTVTLAADASTTIPISFASAKLTGKVIVDLPSENYQAIDFLVPNTIQ